MDRAEKAGRFGLIRRAGRVSEERRARAHGLESSGRGRRGWYSRTFCTCKGAFGIGIHGCLGQLVARAEGETLFAALARKVERIELDGEPERHLNNALRSLTSLPVKVHAA